MKSQINTDSNKLGYYPGCALEGSSIDYSSAIKRVFAELGVTLEPVMDWNCCGATEYTSVYHTASYALVARNLALAEQFLRENKYGEALERLLKATEVDASDARAWRLLGEAYVGLGQASGAITALEQAMGLGLSEAEVRGTLAKAVVQDGRTDEGIKLCQEIAEDAVGRGNPDEAIAACRGLLEIASHLTPVHAYLVRVLQDLGRDQGHEPCRHTWTTKRLIVP